MADDIEHRRFLAKRDFFVPVSIAAGLASDQLGLLQRFGHWMEALVNGVIQPITSNQRRFVRVARGVGRPTTSYEKAWLALRPPRTRSKKTSSQTSMPPRKEIEDLMGRLRGLLARHKITSAFALDVLQEWEANGQLSTRQLSAVHQLVASAEVRQQLPRVLRG